jgi:hypothetical protein
MARRDLRRPLGPVLLALLFLAPSAANIPAVTSLWASAPVLVDGLAGEWPASSLSRDQRSGAEFAFRNDGRYMSILLVLKDPEARKPLEAAGIKILTRPGSKGTPARGVLFAVKMLSAEAYTAWLRSRGDVATEAERAELEKTGRHPVFLSFAIQENGSVYGPLLKRSVDSDPPEFRVATSENGMTCEFRIPLASPEGVPGGIGAGPGETVRVSFAWGGGATSELTAKASREGQSSNSGYLSGTGRTWSQEFLDTFDAMSRPASNSKKYAFVVDVKLAESR